MHFASTTNRQFVNKEGNNNGFLVNHFSMINGRTKCVFDRNGKREGDKLYIYFQIETKKKEREKSSNVASLSRRIHRICHS